VNSDFEKYLSETFLRLTPSFFTKIIFYKYPNCHARFALSYMIRHYIQIGFGKKRREKLRSLMIVTVVFAIHLAPRSVLRKTSPQLSRRHTLPAVISVRITFGRFLKVSCVAGAKKKGNTFDEIRHQHGRRRDFHTGSSVSHIKLRTVWKNDLSLRASVRAMCSFKLLRRRFVERL